MSLFLSQIEHSTNLPLFITPFKHLKHGNCGVRLDGTGPGCGLTSPDCSRKNRNRDPVEGLEKICLVEFKKICFV